MQKIGRDPQAEIPILGGERSKNGRCPNDSFGSKSDLRYRQALRLECDGEPTFSPEGRLGSCGGSASIPDTVAAVLPEDLNAMRTFGVPLSFTCKENSIAPNYRLLSSGCSFI